MKTKKVAKKATKEVKSNVEMSDAVRSILKVAKSAGATKISGNAKRVRVYVGEGESRKPVLRINGLTKDTPSVRIKPALRGESWKQMFHGKLEQKNFKQAGSSYLYKGEQSKLLKRIKIAVHFIALASKAS